MKVTEPPASMQSFRIGDTVEYVDPKRLDAPIVGMIVGTYSHDRVCVKCESGHEWALLFNRLSLVKEGSGREITSK